MSNEHRAQMGAVSDEVDGAGARAEQEGERRLVTLGRIAAWAGEDEVVAAIVRGLAAARRDVVERHHRGGEPRTAVGAHRAMLVEQPGARLDVRVSAGRGRRQRARLG